MNVKTVAATLIVIGGLAAGTATASANPGKCGTPVGFNPPCPATQTATPKASPTRTPQALPPAGFDDGDNDPCKNHPFLNAHNQVKIVNPNMVWQDTDCGQYLIVTVTPTPAPPVVATPVATPVAPPVARQTPPSTPTPVVIPPEIKAPHAGNGGFVGKGKYN